MHTSLTATGGNGKTNYRASLNYKKNDGMIRNTSREKRLMLLSP